jgi:antitoxin component of RelBE/YafQ-DinJ toxin-antitoxin module
MRITFRVDEQLLRRARLRAKAMETTLNDLLRDHLTKLASGEIEPYPPRPRLTFPDETTGSNPERR